MGEERRLSHLSGSGEARMVDVGGKEATARRARAEAVVRIGEGAEKLLRGALKGNVLETARLAGIMGAKRTAGLIPLCHPLSLDVVKVDLELEGESIRIETEVACRAPTGVEMEALTAACVAALTVYDMLKSAARGIEIGPIRLLSKEGGRSGRWVADEG